MILHLFLHFTLIAMGMMLLLNAQPLLQATLQNFLQKKMLAILQRYEFQILKRIYMEKPFKVKQKLLYMM